MASAVEWNDQRVFVSNMVLDRLLDFAEEMGRATAKNAEENATVEKLVAWRASSYFPGVHFDLNEVFPTIDEKKLWARCFHDVARRVFLRSLGKHEATFWQSETIAVAYMIGRWMTTAVQADERWWPDTEDSSESSAWYSKPR